VRLRGRSEPLAGFVSENAILGRRPLLSANRAEAALRVLAEPEMFAIGDHRIFRMLPV
jgi:hypothetical protein